MLVKLLLALTIVPLVELALLIWLGQQIGLGATILLVLLTGVAGAFLAKIQGLLVISQIRWDLMNATLPARSLLEGLCLLVGAALLLTPGLLTDLTGFILLFPTTRRRVAIFLEGYLGRAFKRGSFQIRWW